MKAIAVMELKGFARMAKFLTLKMEGIGLSPERIRAWVSFIDNIGK